jgi:hypothetical protein
MIADLRKLKQRVIQSIKPIDQVATGPRGLAKKWMTCQDYAKKFDGTWMPIYPALPMPRWKKVRQWGRISKSYKKLLKRQIPETGVLVVPQGQVLGIQGYTLGREDYFLPELSFHRDRLEHANLPKRKYPVEHISGTCLSLMTNASNNYCHFLLDVLPRLHLFEKAGIQLQKVDFLHVPKPISENALNIFNQFNLDINKCIWAEREKGFQFDILYTTTYPGLYCNYPRWVADYLQATIYLSPCQPLRRLYIPRPKNRRRVDNEEQLFSLLKTHDFEIVDFEHVQNQPQLFHEAEFIISAHGASLANLVFCQPGTKVLELMSVEHPAPYFYALSHLLGLEHGCIWGDTIEPRKNKHGLCFIDFTIDEKALEKAILEL